MTSSTSRLRRGGRRLRDLPLVGERLRDGYALAERLLWTHVLTPLRRRRLALANRLRDTANTRARTAPNVTRQNTRRAYDRLYGSDRLLAEYLDESRLGFYDSVACEAVRYEPRSVLDVGCGSGHLLRAVADRSALPLELTGVDYSSGAVRRAATVVPEAELAVADLRSFTPGRTFDLVLCTEVLEHVDDSEGARAALSRFVRPGGAVIVTVPDGEQDDWQGHVNFWSLEEFRAFLAPLGDVAVERLGDDVLLGVAVGGRAPGA